MATGVHSAAIPTYSTTNLALVEEDVTKTKQNFQTEYGSHDLLQGPGIPHPLTNLTPTDGFRAGFISSPCSVTCAVASLHLHTLPGSLQIQTTSAKEPP